MDAAIRQEEIERYAREMIAIAKKAGYTVDDEPATRPTPQPAPPAEEEREETTEEPSPPAAPETAPAPEEPAVPPCREDDGL